MTDRFPRDNKESGCESLSGVKTKPFPNFGMTTSAEIQITSGPDRGQQYQFTEELIHVGRDAESQIPLTDPAVAEHQASIAQRNGRYAIYTPIDNTLAVDGNSLPAEQWVWLPVRAEIRISPNTSFLFTYTSESTDQQSRNSGGSSTPPAIPTRKSKSGQSRKSSGAKKTAGSPGPKIAQFITDRAGDHLVRLGEDGQLPELTLSEAHHKAKARQEKTRQNPALLYIALGISLLASLSMLLIEPGSGGSTAAEKEKARKEIEKFYGDDDDELKPYQQALREARRAHSINNKQAELRAYQRVLDELNAEDVVNSFNGLTGDKKDDEKLRELIGILLNR
ncbi:MAG: hypothetical protein Tsb009_29610 [Planctomycetaceae bacterium]